tara:strand:- start:1996 stop:2139 length:144 start_codon:yes stop_codon:yes gene_type:complete
MPCRAHEISDVQHMGLIMRQANNAADIFGGAGKGHGGGAASVVYISS